MGSSRRGAGISALAFDVLGSLRSGVASGAKTLPVGSVRSLAANARRDSRGYLYQLLERRFAVVRAVEKNEGSGCVGPANAAHAIHQPGRSDVALDHEGD